jgi:pimeloyl-ACP methyl ester carboxylesterase
MTANRAFNIVLVHGGFVDGSGWEPVYMLLQHEGFNVSVVQNDTSSLAGDVAITKLTLATLDRPSLLVGHSYGGAVITEAGNDPNVIGLVYIAAFVPDIGESVQKLINTHRADLPPPPILPARDGHLFLDKLRFREAFAHDVYAHKARFMADSQHAAAMGCRRSRRDDQAGGVAQEDKLVPRRNRGSNDSARCAALHGKTRRRDHARSEGQPRDLSVSTRGRRRRDRDSG